MRGKRRDAERLEAKSQDTEKDLEPNLSQFPRIRLLINGAIQSEVEILLTGFTARTVISGTAMIDGSTGTEYPDYPSDGEFLGPAEYPWANKIVFSTPSAALNVLLLGRRCAIVLKYSKVCLFF